MTEQERAADSDLATSPYLSLREAVRPAILAHWLLAGDQERAGKLAAECEDLLFLTRELLKAAGRVRILAGAAPLAERPAPSAGSRLASEEGGGDRPAQLLDAYAEAGLLWAKVVGCSVALAGALIDRGEWEDVRRLADFLAGAGEESAARDLRTQLGKAVWERHREPLQGIGAAMPPSRDQGRPSRRCGPCCATFLRTSPTGTGRSTASWPPLAAAIHAIMKDQDIDIPFTSRVEHIATGGVAKYPDIVKMSLDELAAEFEGICS